MTVLAAVPAPTDQTLSSRDARELTGRIRTLLGEALDLIADAWAGRAWEALGYASWTDYLAAELPEVKLLRLPVDVRREAVARWSARGMSQSAMAKGLNVSAGTVNADVRLVVPEPEEGAVVVSLDNRRRPARTRTAKPAPEPAARVTRTDEALALVRAAGAVGLTSTELARRAGWERDLASATLSRLEKRKAVRRVGVFREGRGAYVLVSLG